LSSLPIFYIYKTQISTNYYYASEREYEKVQLYLQNTYICLHICMNIYYLHMMDMFCVCNKLSNKFWPLSGQKAKITLIMMAKEIQWKRAINWLILTTQLEKIVALTNQLSDFPITNLNIIKGYYFITLVNNY
jgi:hypothetical protein